MRVLDLFSGIGGFSLGLERAGMKTVAFCEIDPFCQKVLRKHWPEVPIYNDVRAITKEYHGTVDLICGGYPCQPFSVAGKQKGHEDKRHLWPAMRDCIHHYRPTWVICENVYGHIRKGLDAVLSDLENLGYTVWVACLSAKSFGANHGRERVWVVANTTGYGCHEGKGGRGFDPSYGDSTEGEKKARDYEGCSGLRAILERAGYSPWCWGAKPPSYRVDDGLPNRMDRLKSLGNAVVPQIPEIIGRAIMEVEE